jgi:hypothetical protein
MQSFDNIIGLTIMDIQILDHEVDYEYYSPYAIVFTIEDQKDKLIVSAKNDGTSIDISMATDEQIESDYGLEFNELILNDLRKEDELTQFLGNKIKEVKIGIFKMPEIKGIDFIILQDKYKGLKLITDKHTLFFQNNYGGWCDFDNDVNEQLENERWEWI